MSARQASDIDFAPTMLGDVRGTMQLAGPVIVTQLAHMSMGFVDTVMVGRLGPESLAAVALANSIVFGALIFGMGAVTAVSPTVSQAFGAGDDDMVGRSTRQGLWLSLAIAIPIILLIRNVPPLLLAMGQDPLTVERATGYLHAISWGVPPFLWFVALRSFTEGVSRPEPPRRVALIGVVLNILFNYVLMYGKMGFPALGIVGTGYASTLVYWSNFLMLLAYAGRSQHFIKYEIVTKLRRPDLALLWVLTKLGVPIGIQFGVEAGLFAATALLMGLFGDTALAAHQVAIQCAAFAFMVPLGIGIATSVRVGQAAGRRDPPGTYRAGLAGIGLAAAFMFATALAFWLVPRNIVGLYLQLDDANNAEVIRLAVQLLGLAAIFQIFDGIQVAAAGALRGIKDTTMPMILSVLSYWAIGLSTGVVLGFYLDWGPRGLWWGLVVGLAAASGMLHVRFVRLSRRAIVPAGVAETGNAAETADDRTPPTYPS